MKRSKEDWKEGTVQEFLGLSDVDMALVETKVALAQSEMGGDGKQGCSTLETSN